MTWRVVNDSLLVGRFGAATTLQSALAPQGKRKIAAFDFVCEPRSRPSQPPMSVPVRVKPPVLMPGCGRTRH